MGVLETLFGPKEEENDLPASQSGAAVAEILQREYGIEISQADPKELEQPGFFQVTGDVAARCLGALQPLAGLWSNQAIQGEYQEVYKGACRILTPVNEGSRLMSAKGYGPDAFRGSTVRVGGNGKNTMDQNLVFQKIDPSTVSAAPQIAYAAFSAASVVTGQYFMQRIDKKLGAIQQSTQEILQFLELDKRCRLEAQNAYLREVFQNLDAILTCPAQLQAVLGKLQDIRQNALADLMFYRERAKAAAMEKEKKEKAEKAMERLDKVATDLPSYWFSLRAYCLSSVLELLLTKNENSAYLRHRRDDLMEQCGAYQACYRECEERIKDRIQEIGPNKIPFTAAKVVGKATQFASLSLGVVGGAVGYAAGSFTKAMADGIYSKLQTRIQDQARESYARQTAEYAQVDQLQAMADSVALLDRIYHTPAELVMSDQKLYFKLPEALQET